MDCNETGRNETASPLTLALKEIVLGDFSSLDTSFNSACNLVMRCSSAPRAWAWARRCRSSPAPAEARAGTRILQCVLHIIRDDAEGAQLHREKLNLMGHQGGLLQTIQKLQNLCQYLTPCRDVAINMYTSTELPKWISRCIYYQVCVV